MAAARSGTTGWLVAALMLFVGVPVPAAEPPPRWVYLMMNLQVKENVPVAEKLMRRAAAAGYNGIVLADFKLTILDRVPDWYFSNFAKVRATADELHLEIIPCVASFGYSNGLLMHDPDLAEGLPVRDQRFRITNGAAVLDSKLRNPLPGGTFENHRGDKAIGWNYQDEPGKVTHIDTRIRHGGKASLRISKEGGDSPNARVTKLLEVEPWRPYHASVWIRTEDFRPNGEIRMFALTESGKTLSYSNLGVKPTQEWTQHHVAFNSLGHSKVRLYCGVWGMGSGKMWIDDVAIHETSFVNLVQRPSAPLVVTAADGTTLEQGRDFEPLRDAVMHEKASVGQFEIWHEPPALKLKPGSRVKDGDVVTASYFHTVSIHDEQVPISLSDPKAMAIVKDQVERVQKLLQPKTWFLSHDEIRIANWDGPEGRTAGEVLAENVCNCVKIVRGASPGAKIVIWSDMFDPHHNAVDDYYLVRGSLARSWEGLDRDVGVVNWNSGKAEKSLSFFAGRGHRQILAGYYDANPAAIRDWQAKAKGLTGVNGVMYTTWRNDFSQLEAFARAAWGAK